MTRPDSRAGSAPGPNWSRSRPDEERWARLVAAAIVATTALAWQADAQAQTPAAATQSSSERGVTVKVTPKPAAPGGEPSARVFRWDGAPAR